MLYELLTGKRAFEGKTITETIAAVPKSEPDWEQLPSDTPWRIKELLDDSLQKEAHDQLPDLANVRIQINKALQDSTVAFPIGVSSEVQGHSYSGNSNLLINVSASLHGQEPGEPLYMAEA